MKESTHVTISGFDGGFGMIARIILLFCAISASCALTDISVRGVQTECQ